MKNSTLFIISFFMCISFFSKAQERENVVRQKLQLSIDAQSEVLSRIPGWSRIETKDGKFWKQSDLNDELSYLPHPFIISYNDGEVIYGNNKLNLGFKSLRIYKFTLEGSTFYLLNKVLKGENRYYIFTKTSFDWLGLEIENALGIENQCIDIKYCGNQDGIFNPELIFQDKEMIRVLLLGKGSYTSYYSCKGDSLFLINSQVLKGDTIVRFNFEINVAPTFAAQKSILPLTYDYFELKKSDFCKLFKLSPYLGYNELKRRDELVKKQKDNLRINDLQNYYDSLNTTFNSFKYPESTGVNKKMHVYERIGDCPKLLKNNTDLSTFFDNTYIDDNKQFNLTIGINGKIKFAPVQQKLFNQLMFSPGTIRVYFGDDYETWSGGFYYSEKDCSNGKCKLFSRTMTIPAYFTKRYAKQSEYFPSKIIIKFKKSRKGIDIQNQYYKDKNLFDEVKARIFQDNTLFENLENGKYYFYFTREIKTWNLVLFPRYDNIEQISEDFHINYDKQELKNFNSENFDELCP